MARLKYTDEQRVAALACLEANAGNYDKTARETGIDKKTLRRWAATPLSNAPELPAIKKQIADDFIDKLKRTRARLIDRIYTVSETEEDIYKLSGAFKTVMDAVGDEEVSQALATRIRGAAEASPAPSVEDDGSPSERAPTYN